MFKRTFKRNEGLAARPWLVLGSIALVTISAACAESTGPDTTGGVDQDTATVLPATGVSEDDLSPSGTVTETTDGFIVEGSLGIATSDTTTITFLDADLRVRKDASGNVTSISGTAEIPPPHERIEFEDPVRANVGFFTGEYLNREGDIGILLNDDTDYFVFDFGLAFQMKHRDGRDRAGRGQARQREGPRWRAHPDGRRLHGPHVLRLRRPGCHR
ncbi:MAG TPA: hypothetical protein VMM35_01215 [Longimicrobiales bacterium]|nr:hypothetical protein [Longimicrobiales bacterium]